MLHTRRMSGLSKVIVLDPDVRASRQIQLGFEREGLPAAVVQLPVDSTKLALFNGSGDDDASLVIVGGNMESRALDLIRRTRALLDEAHVDAPIVFAGRGVRRTEAEAAGADEVVLQPVHLRDVVTVGRLLRGSPAHQRRHLVGNLAETTGVFTLVRALAALGRSAVLTLIRGLRRGEVRFYHGEVTSAQVGVIHGQAALHQLLLWTDARFDFRHEDVVRRQQIPLPHDELFADAERFLATVRSSSGALSPSMVLEQNVVKIHSLGNQIPTEVHGVLRMFDGHRVLADVLEDSPYRVFETLRVAQRALDVGLLRQASVPRPKATWRAVLAIEEWLVGNNDRPRHPTETESGPIQTVDTGPVLKGSRRKRKKRRANTPLTVPAIQTKPEIDWGALVPRVVGAEAGPLAGVVPAGHASGEIVLSPASREEPREKLEALMDTDKREKIFPRDIGLEPKVVWSEAEEQAAIAAAVAPRPEEQEPLTASATGADELAARIARGREGTEAAAAQKTRLEADAKAAADMAARAQAEATAKVRAEADARQREQEVAAAAEAARVVAAEAERLAKHRADEDARQAATVEAKLRADSEAAAEAERQAKLAAEAEQAMRAASVKTPVKGGDSKRNRAARREAKRRDTLEARSIAQARAEAEAKVVAGDGDDDRTRPRERVELDESARARAPVDASASDLVRQLVADESAASEIQTPSVVVTETPGATVLVADVLTVSGTDTTAKLVATPLATVTEPPDAAAARLVATPIAPRVAPAEAPAGEATPVETYDEPSDGVIREHVEVAHRTAPPPPAVVSPVDDRPGDATGEITSPIAHEDMVEVAPEPSILVSDLVAVHSAVSAVASAQIGAPPTPNAATVSKEHAVATVSTDAAEAFNDVEEAFFRGGDESKQQPKVSSESFDDLDEGYQPVGFWDRLLGRKPPKPPAR